MDPYLVSEMVPLRKLRQLNKMYRTMSYREHIGDLLSEGRLQPTRDYTVEYIKEHPDSVYWLTTIDEDYMPREYVMDVHHRVGVSSGDVFNLTEEQDEYGSSTSPPWFASISFTEVLEQALKYRQGGGTLTLVGGYLDLYDMIISDPKNAAYLEENEVIFRREVALWVVDKARKYINEYYKRVGEDGESTDEYPETTTDTYDNIMLDSYNFGVHLSYFWLYRNCVALGLRIEMISFDDDFSSDFDYNDSTSDPDDKFYSEIDRLSELLLSELEAKLL